MVPTFLQLVIQYSSIALLYYDYALTFEMEFEYMWRSPVRLSTMLYIACRYALPANILYLLAITDNLHGSCDTWYKMIGALSVIGRIAIIFVWSGRNGAIYYPKNRWVLAICGTLGTICIILDILHVPGLRCSKSSSNPIAAELLSILMAVFEFTSAGLMAIRGIQELRDCHSSISSKRSLEYLLYEQGMLYFGIVFLFTTASVVLNYRAHGGFLQRLLDAFTLPLSGLLTARFLLHLRRWDSKTCIRSAGRAMGDPRILTGTLPIPMDQFVSDPSQHCSDLNNHPSGTAGK